MKQASSSMRLVLPLMTTLLLIALSGCSGNTDEQPAAGASTGAVVGGSVPDFELKRLDGSTLQLSSLRGKAVLIDFWDTWCPPCVAAMPHLQEISTQHAGDLVVVGIAFGRQGPDAVDKFVRSKGLTFEFVLADEKVIDAFGDLQSIPTTFLVDAQGRVTNKWVGGQSKSVYESAVRAALGS